MTDTAPTPLKALVLSLIWPIYVPSFFASTALNALTIMLPLYVLSVTGSAAFAATVVGVFGLGQMLVGVPAGVAVARFGDNRVALCALTSLVLVVLGFAFLESRFAFIVLAFALGAMTGAWQMARLNYMTEATAVENRGRAFSISAGLQRTGWLIGPVAGGLIADLAGFRMMFLVIAAAYLTAIIFVLRFSRHDPGRRDPGSASMRVWAVAKDNRHTLLTAGPAIAGLKVLRASRTLILPLWGAHIGLSPSEIGLVFGITSIIDMLMFYPAGMMVDHFGRRSVLVPAIVLMGSAVGLLGFTHDLTGFALLSLLGALGNGFSTGINMTLGGDFAPPDRRGEFLGLWRLIGELGTGAGPFVISALVGTSGIAFAGVAVAGIGATALGFVIFLLPEPLVRK